MEEQETTLIRTGVYIERNGKYLGIENIGERVWTNNLEIATLYNERMTLEDAKDFMEELGLDIDNISLVPVKRITDYQIGEF